jgi:hypothetical protein
MKKLNELTLEEIRTKFHKLESKRNWHLSRWHSNEDSEKKCIELRKEMDKIVTFLQNKVKVLNIINNIN